MKSYCYIFFIVFLCIGMSNTMIYAASSEEFEIYFHAGTEKYLKGSFTESIEMLEKAQAIEPNNLKIKEFMTKILLEAATNEHMTHNYPQAFEYLKKAMKISPENPRVQEMYQLTESLLTPQNTKAGKASKISQTAAQEQIKEEKEKPEPKKTEPKEVRQPKKQDEKKPYTPKPAVISKNLERSVDGDYGEYQRQNPKKQDNSLLIWATITTVLLVVTLVLLAVKSFTSSSLKKKIDQLERKIADSNEENRNARFELDKIKEKLKYEHQITEQSQKELKESNSREKERIQAELELRSRKLEEKIRSEMTERTSKKYDPRDAFLHQQQAKFLEYVDDSSSIDEVSSPAIESSRERISVMAQNLYEYAPAAAIDFLSKMASNPNPLIRSNVVRALAGISSSETFNILFNLSSDPDQRVKREVLKNFKNIIQQVVSGTKYLEPEIKEKIKTILNNERLKGEWVF